MRSILLLLTTSLVLNASYVPSEEGIGINDQFTDWWIDTINQTGGPESLSYEEFRAHVLANPPPQYRDAIDNLTISEPIDLDDLNSNNLVNQSLTPSLINTANGIQHDLEENDGSSEEINDIIDTVSVVENNASGAGGDNDNDVPAIQEVEKAVDRVYTKVEEARQEIFDLRGKHEDNGTLKDTQLSDIYNALVRNRGDFENDALLSLSTNVDELEQQTQNEVDAIEEAVPDNIFSLPDEQGQIPQALVSMDGVMGGASINLFDMASSIPGASLLPSVEEVAKWVKAIIGAFCIVLYWRATLDLVQNSIRDATMMVEANPVSNYGGAIGGVVNLPVKIAKLGLFVPFLAAFTGSLILMLEADIVMKGSGVFDGMGADNLFAIVTGETDPGRGNWIAITWDLFEMVIPYITLSFMFVTYWFNKFLLYGTFFVFNRATRALT